MSHAYKLTQHPLTNQFEKAAWIEVGRCSYVVFADGRWYHEQYRAWDCQEGGNSAPIERTAGMANAVVVNPIEAVRDSSSARQPMRA